MKIRQKTPPPAPESRLSKVLVITLVVETQPPTETFKGGYEEWGQFFVPVRPQAGDSLSVERNQEEILLEVIHVNLHTIPVDLKGGPLPRGAVEYGGLRIQVVTRVMAESPIGQPAPDTARR